MTSCKLILGVNGNGNKLESDPLFSISITRLYYGLKASERISYNYIPYTNQKNPNISGDKKGCASSHEQQQKPEKENSNTKTNNNNNHYNLHRINNRNIFFNNIW